MTPEQKQLEQIEGRLAAHKQEIAKYRNHEWAKGDALHYYEAPDDVDLLLSLVKSQEAERDPEIERVAIAGIQEGLRQRDEMTATAMRSACVEKVEAFRDASYWSDVNRMALTKLIEELESLSIEKPKE